MIAGEFVLGFVNHEMTQTLKVVNDTATAIIALEAGSELKLKARQAAAEDAARHHAVRRDRLDVRDLPRVLFLMRPLLPDIFGNLDFVPSLVVCARDRRPRCRRSRRRS